MLVVVRRPGLTGVCQTPGSDGLSDLSRSPLSSPTASLTVRHAVPA